MVDRSRRRMLTSIGTGAFVGTAGCLGGDGSKEASLDGEDVGFTGETITVDGSIQDAVDSASAEDTIEVPPGTYEEFVRIETDLSLVAPEGATLDGRNITAEDPEEGAIGFKIDAETVEIEGFALVGYEDAAIATESDAARIELRDLAVIDTEGDGIDVEAETLRLTTSAVENAGGAGARLTASRTGAVLVEDVTVDSSMGHGISVAGGETVEIVDVETLRNDHGVHIVGGAARNQAVSVDTVRATDNATGLRIDAAGGTDERTIENVEILDGRGGLTVAGDLISISDVFVDGPDVGNLHSAGIEVDSTPDGTVDIRNVEIEDVIGSSQNDKAGRGIAVVDGADVTLENVDISRVHGKIIHVETDHVRDRNVSLTNATLVDNSKSSAVHVEGAGGRDEVSVERVETRDTADGLEIEGDDVTVRDIDVDGTFGGGIEVVSSADGDVAIRDVSVNDSKSASSYGPGGRGIEVTDGSSVTVDTATVTRSYGENLFIEADDVRSQTVEITDVSAETNAEGSGIVVTGSSGDDEVTVTRTTSIDHEDYGYDLGGESIAIEDSEASDNEDGTLNLRDIDRSAATITNSSV